MKVRKINRRGRTEWILDYSLNNRRFRKWFRTRSQAEAEMDNIKSQIKVAGKSWLSMSGPERAQLLLTVEEIKQSGFTLQQVWDAFKSKTFDVAPAVTRTLLDAIRETMAAKRAGGRRERYLDSLEDYLNKFAAGRETMPVSKITPAMIGEWFAARNEGPSTRKSNTGRLGSLFGFCFRRGYIRDNPIERMETITLDTKPPVILSPWRTARLLITTWRNEPSMMPYVVLGLFAGIRPEELEKLTWSAVDIARRRVIVEGKTRRRRIVQLNETAMAWMVICTPKEPKPDELIAPASLKRRRRRIRDLSRIEWHQDILRHTAASYLLALHQDAQKVALMLGNSPAILLKHYRELVTPEESSKFFALRPGKRML